MYGIPLQPGETWTYRTGTGGWSDASIEPVNCAAFAVPCWLYTPYLVMEQEQQQEAAGR